MMLASAGTSGKISRNSGFPDGNTPVGLLAELADAMDSKSIAANPQSPAQSQLTQRAADCVSAGVSLNPSNDADLQAIIDAWPTLPEPIKAGILAMIGATRGPERRVQTS